MVSCWNVFLSGLVAVCAEKEHAPGSDRHRQAHFVKAYSNVRCDSLRVLAPSLNTLWIKRPVRLKQ